jgi:hypothetical protein
MGTGWNIPLLLGVQHPVIPAPVSAGPEPAQVQMGEILRPLNHREELISSLQEANAAQANTIAFMRSAMASDMCQIGGESFNLELAASAFGLKKC